MPDLVPLAGATVPEIVTLVVPLGLFLLTLAWLGWLLHGRALARRGELWPQPPTTTALQNPPPDEPGAGGGRAAPPPGGD